MNKKLAAFYAEQGMTVTGNKAYGIVKGYEVNAVLLNGTAVYGGVMPFQFHFSFYATDEQKRNMEAALRNETIKFCKMQFTQYGLAVGLNDLTYGKLIKRLPSLFELFTGIIAQNGGLTSEYCPVCGNPMGENKQTCNIDKFTIHIDSDCVERINAVIAAENKEFDEAPNNYLRGFCGALIGGLAGAVVAVVLYAVGFYSSLAAIVSVLLGSFLYKTFHGKPNKMMLVIVAATTVVCMVLSVFLIYLIAAGMAASREGLAISAFEAFGIVMKDAEVSKAFYLDMVMVLLFSAIGIGVQIAYMAQAVKRKKSIK